MFCADVQLGCGCAGDMHCERDFNLLGREKEALRRVDDSQLSGSKECMRRRTVIGSIRSQPGSASIVVRR